MDATRIRGLLLTLLFGSGLALGVPASATPAPATPAGETLAAVAPAPDQAAISDQIITRLAQAHYRDQPLDDGLSQRLFDRYLARLDPWRAYFLASDIQAFAPYRDRLDDALREGDLEPVYAIFNRFQERRAERADLLLELLANELETLDTDAGGSLPIDRSTAPWPATREEADALWRARFVNDVLSLELVGRSRDEIAQILERRYATQRRRLGQITTDDVFALYMGVVTNSYDPHTQYLPPQAAENFDISMRLSLEGIGALLGADGDYCEIVRLIPAGPAEKSGLVSPGDRILAVGQGSDGELVDIVGWRTTEAVDLIRGPKGSVVRLELLPAELPEGSSSRTVEIVRDEVKLEEQAARRSIVEVQRGEQSYRIGVVELPAFYVDFEAARSGAKDFRSSTRDVERLLRELDAEGVDGIVLDLRDNGGGSLIEARTLSGAFVGPAPVVQVRGANDAVEVVWSGRRQPVYDGPLAVLVNRLSASASEILAAAVQDTGRGVVVGRTTFGKGTVQQVQPLGEGQLNVTQAKFYRISGGSTQSRGVEPDVVFPATYDADEIGESALEEALPWDSIDPVSYARDGRIAELAPELQRRHDERLASDPELLAMVERLAFAQEQDAIGEVSLSRTARQAEREQTEARLLAIENRRRAARGEEPVASLDAVERVPRGEVDVLAREAAAVLADLVALAERDDRVH